MRISIMLQALLIGAFFGCTNPTSETRVDSMSHESTDSIMTDSLEVKTEIVEEEKEKRPKPYEWVGEDPFFFVPVDAFNKEDEEKAIAWVEERQAQGQKACYLWIPKFKSLSGTKKFAVGYGDFNTIDECVNAVDSLKAEGQVAVYGLRVNEQGDRFEIRGGDNLKLNGKSVDPIDDNTPKVVLIFDPDIYEKASEEWGAFSFEVYEACLEQGVFVEAVYNDFEHVTVKNEEGIVGQYDISEFVDQGVRGYVAIHGYKKIFVIHNMPGRVLKDLSNFFGEEISQVQSD